MATLRLASGNLNDLIMTEIQSVVSQYSVDLLKDRKKQTELKNELKSQVGLGEWTVQITGSNIRFSVVSENGKRASWTF